NSAACSVSSAPAEPAGAKNPAAPEEQTRCSKRAALWTRPFRMALDLSRFLSGSESFRKIAAGQPIFAIDEPGSSMFVVRSGSVEIRIGDLVYETVGPGGIIGEMALLDPDIR